MLEIPVTRENIISYFESKDKSIAKVLNRKIPDCRVPFETAYKFHKYYSEDTNIMDLILSSSMINKYKGWIRVPAISIKNERKNKFVDTIIRERRVNSEIEKLKFSVFIADQIIKDVIEDRGFKHIVNKKESHLLDYILIDFPNLYNRIKNEYKGKDETIINMRDNIIGKKNMRDCILDFIKYFDENINAESYNLIVISHFNEVEYGDNYVIIPISCEPYIGERCDYKGSSSQVDDIVLVMLYDYLSISKELNVSILSGDNFDFHTMTLDCIESLKRAMISASDPPVLLSYEDLIFSGIDLTSLAIFEEEMV